MNPQDKPKDDNHKARAKERAEADNAANLIRQKLDSLYAEEPNAKTEALEAVEAARPRSKHQQFMYELSESGKSLAEIQTAWHKYYADLPDKEKHQVWEEFYEANNRSSHFAASQAQAPPSPKSEVQIVEAPAPHKPEHTQHHKKLRTPDLSSVAEIKQRLIPRAGNARKLKARQHLQSLMFGFGLGSLVILALLFSFFNERFIAPFIMPSRHVSSTPIIIDPGSADVGPQPKVIIPKINVEGPVVYDEPSIDDKAVEKALERGVVHYATTPSPGEKGNVVIVGHSSGNILNRGKAKFAFVLLSWLEKGDLFYLTKDGKRFIYKVYKKEIVQPTDVRVLGPADKPDTATLITCDPPGTSWHRLIVVGEQISPVPTDNLASTAVKSDKQPNVIPSNSQSLWQRVKDWFTS